MQVVGSIVVEVETVVVEVVLSCAIDAATKLVNVRRIWEGRIAADGVGSFQWRLTRA